MLSGSYKKGNKSTVGSKLDPVEIENLAEIKSRQNMIMEKLSDENTNAYLENFLQGIHDRKQNIDWKELRNNTNRISKTWNEY